MVWKWFPVLEAFISASRPEESKEVNQSAEVTPGDEVAPIYGRSRVISC